MEVSGHLHALASLPPGKEPRYALDRMKGRPQSQSGLGDEEKNICPCWKWNPARLSRNLVTILSELPRHFLLFSSTIESGWPTSEFDPRITRRADPRRGRGEAIGN
jgi:hypothetical protein